MIRIDPEFQSIIPPLTEDEYADLQESLLKEGCRDPIVIWNGTIVDGHNRYEICQKHGISFTKIEKEFKDRDEALKWIIENQLGRRNLPPYERARLALKLKPTLATQAKKRQGRRDKIIPFPQISAGRETRDILARRAGMSHDTISRVEKIEAEASPEIKQQLRDNIISINEAYKRVKAEEKKQQREAAIAEQISQPKASTHIDIYTTENKYRVIYADPPWAYNDKQNTDTLGGAEKHYPTMTIPELCVLPVPSDDNAVLFLWVTSPLLEDCFRVIKAWGFTYKSSFVWDKVKHNMGHYNSVRHEFLLICTKGSCTPDVPKLYDSVQSIERSEHSRKPQEFREIIDTLYPAGKRLEMFAREAPEGWDVWGNMA